MRRVLFHILFLTCAAAIAQETSFRHFNTDRLLFEENRGQVADENGNVQNDVLFVLKSRQVTVYFRKHGLSYQWNVVNEKPLPFGPFNEATGEFTQPQDQHVNRATVQSFRADMVWNGASEHVNVYASDAEEGITNYFLGHCKEGVRNVRSFKRLIYKNLYPGIDVEYYINERGNLKYDVHVQGGADPSVLSYSFEGVMPEIVDGKVRISTPLGFIEEQVPVAWKAAAQDKKVNVRYRMDKKRLGYVLERFDEPVVIDPEIIWSTYYGGTGSDEGYAVQTDASGNVFLAGASNSTAGISASPGCITVKATNQDAFVVKFGPDGDTRLWASYYGGSGTEAAQSIAIDPQGDVYIGGTTTSMDLPNVTYMPDKPGTISGPVAFLAKLGSGGQCLWATYYGGMNESYGRAVAADNAGNVYLAGYAQGGISDIQDATVGHDRTYSNPQLSYNPDAFLVKFNSTGTTRYWATYYGGEYNEYGYAVTVDQQNNVYLAGVTSTGVGDQHADISTSGAFQVIQGGGEDGFVVKFNEEGTRLWGTYFGGTGTDEIRSITLDNEGNFYLGGNTNSTSGIATGGAFQTTKGLYYDAFVAKFSGTGSRLWASYFGGNGGTNDINGGDQLFATSVDGKGNVLLAGRTNSTGLAANGFQNNLAGNFDAFVVMLSADGATRKWSTYFGGVNNDFGNSVAYHTSGVYLAGVTASTNLSTAGAVQPTYGGSGSDAFLAKIVVPEIVSENFPVVAQKKQSTPVSVTFNYSTNSTVRFWSKGISEPSAAWKNEQLSSGGSTFTKNLTSSELTDPIGLTFYFELTDNSQATLRSSEGNVWIGYQAGDNLIPGLRFGNQVSDYQIVASPVVLENAAVTSVLDELGAYDKKRWRFFRYYENDNREYPAFSTIQPGVGYWLIVRNSVSIDPGMGHTVQVTESDPFVISLNTGWNLIGNPYDFRISWQDVLEHNGNPASVGNLTVFSNGELVEADVLDRYRGAFVFSDASTVLEIPVLRNTTLGGRMRAQKSGNPLDDSHWEVPLIVSHQDLTNKLAAIGMHPQATLEGKDAFDEVSVPLLEGMGFFELQIKHPEVNADFSRDVVPTSMQHTWRISVRRDSSHPLKLSWDNSHFGANTQELFLFNPSTSHVVNMREVNEVTVDESSEEIWVIFGQQAYIDEVLDTQLFGLGNPYPVPSDGVVHIPVWIPKSDGTREVSVDVFDSMGRHVSNVVNTNLACGLHTMQWHSEQAGLFVVKMKMGKVTFSRKIIVR